MKTKRFPRWLLAVGVAAVLSGCATKGPTTEELAEWDAIPKDGKAIIVMIRPAWPSPVSMMGTFSIDGVEHAQMDEKTCLIEEIPTGTHVLKMEFSSWLGPSPQTLTVGIKDKTVRYFFYYFRDGSNYMEKRLIEITELQARMRGFNLHPDEEIAKNPDRKVLLNRSDLPMLN